jgi:hypothetical protein
MRLFLALLAALALAGPAGSRATAEPPAELFVFPFDTTPGAAAETDVDLSLPDSSGLAIAAVTEYVPAGYTVALDRPPGTSVGTATLFVAGQLDPVSAGLFTADPTQLATDSCAPGLHAGVWTATLDSGPLTIFVDPTSGDESARGAYRLVYCLPAPEASRIVDVDLDLHGVLTNAAAGGLLTWRAVVTPYGPGTVTPLTDSAFEVRSIVGLPQILGFRPGFAPRTNALMLRGRLVSVGAPRRGINIHFAVATRADLTDAQDLGVARTRADGTYSLQRAFARKRAKQQLILIAYVNFYVGACSDPPLAPGGCAEQSIAPPPARFVTLTIPKLPARR